MNLRDVTAAAADRILDAAQVRGAIPARTWSNVHAPDPGDPETTFTVEVTAPGDTEVQLCIDGPDDVCLDRDQFAELVTDLLCRLVLIAGRHAAVQAAAALPVIPLPGSTQPDRVWTVTGWPTDRVWTVSDSGRDALRGPVITGTGTPGGLTPTDPRSPGSGSAGGAR